MSNQPPRSHRSQLVGLANERLSWSATRVLLDRRRDGGEKSMKNSAISSNHHRLSARAVRLPFGGDGRQCAPAIHEADSHRVERRCAGAMVRCPCQSAPPPRSNGPPNSFLLLVNLDLCNRRWRRAWGTKRGGGPPISDGAWTTCGVPRWHRASFGPHERGNPTVRGSRLRRDHRKKCLLAQRR